LQRNVLIFAALAGTLGVLASARTHAIDPGLRLEQLQHSSWTARDGAPTYVQMMAQTDDGFLWFATGSGLVRFDGVQFERYVAADGRPLPRRRSDRSSHCPATRCWSVGSGAVSHSFATGA
jgi:ligand-binding sensor domain-containing protein